jgi:uncharacterized membrane protein required for colicin V production
MGLDLFCLGFLLFFGVIGALTGFVRQVIHLFAVGLGYAAARFGGPMVGQAIAGGLPALVAPLVGSAVAFFTTFMVVHLVGRFLSPKKELRGAWDRGLGSLFALTKAGLMLWVVLSLMVFLEKPLQGFRWSFSAGNSDLIALVRDHNLFASYQHPQLEALMSLYRASQDPKQAEKLMGDPNAAKLLADPRMKALIKNPEAGKAASKNDSMGFLRAAGGLLGDGAFTQGLEIMEKGELPDRTVEVEKALEESQKKRESKHYYDRDKSKHYYDR